MIAAEGLAVIEKCAGHGNTLFKFGASSWPTETRWATFVSSAAVTDSRPKTAQTAQFDSGGHFSNMSKHPHAHPAKPPRNLRHFQTLMVKILMLMMSRSQCWTHHFLGMRVIEINQVPEFQPTQTSKNLAK